MLSAVLLGSILNCLKRKKGGYLNSGNILVSKRLIIEIILGLKTFIWIYQTR